MQTSVVVVHGLSCSTICGIFWDQGSNRCIARWILNHCITSEVLSLSLTNSTGHISVHSFERNSPSGDASVITMIELLGGDIPEVTLSHEVSAKKYSPEN